MSLLSVWKVRSPAVARYLRQMYIIAILYAAILIPVTYVVRRDMVSGYIVYVLAILPALPILGFFWAIMRLLVEMQDEYQRCSICRLKRFFRVATQIDFSKLVIYP